MLVMPVLRCLAFRVRKPAQRIHLACGFARALIDIHKCGIVHGDIKPHNLYVDDDSEAKIGDFGSAVDMLNGPTDFQGTPTFTVNGRGENGPSRQADFEALCLSVLWWKAPWWSRNDVPPWSTVLADEPARAAWTIYRDTIRSE